MEGDLLNISQMNGNQSQVTQPPGPIIGGGFQWSGGCDAPSLISLANAFLSPLKNYVKMFRSKVCSRFLMTAERVGNFRCAAPRNDCNAKADAGTSCCSPTSSRWQDGGTHSSSLSLGAAGFSVYVTLQILGAVTIKKTQYIRGSVREGSCKQLWWKTPELCAVLGVWLWVWWGQWKNLVSHSLCVPVHVLVEWQPTNSSTVWF